jgi:2-dehydro-3-deoxyphosphogluconate aldolase / (4S)-4-hydroxy-2-oxoglutarate aldolase
MQEKSFAVKQKTNASPIGRSDMAQRLAAQGFLPLFNCDDAGRAVRAVEALHSGGVQIVEFTNRSACALAVFRELAADIGRRLPDVVLGVGSITDGVQAKAFHEAGAAFLVAPAVDADVGTFCLERDIFWCPGAATVTEILTAHRLGAEVIKLFPADLLGGPAFVKAVRGPCPWLKLMPSGGVTCEEVNLRAWFASGVHCVGLGSNLIDAATLSQEQFNDLTQRTRRIVSLMAAIPR